MARLETQINQIYLTHPEAKKTSLVLYEETLSSSLHLFVLAELRDLTRKSEATDLKKISEIILASFRANRKLAGEALFEASLAQINQNLADIAHAGRKSWVGKFSCVITLKAVDNIFLANNGQASAWLKRGGELSEILPAEKRGDHPLKTFQNFTQGKISVQDGLILTTANIFNYVSLQLFTKILGQYSLSEACVEIAKILQASMSADDAFCSFFLGFDRKPAASVATPEDPINPTPVYAPLPEEMAFEPKPSWSLPKFQFNFRHPNLQFDFFRRLSLAGKFFFISFAIFAVLFIINLVVYGFKLHGQTAADKIAKQITVVTSDLAQTQSSVIYKDDQQSFKFLTQTLSDFEVLKKMSAPAADQFTAQIQQITDQVNKITVATDPKVYAEFKRHPSFIAKSPSGFLLSAKDSNSISLYNTANHDYFLLNSLKTDITGISFWSPVGVAVATADQIFHIDNNLKQFTTVLSFAGSTIANIQTYGSNLYGLDTGQGQIIRLTNSKNKISSSIVARGDYSQVRDFGVDKDIYLLGADRLTKITGGAAQAFPLPFMTEPISNATGLFVASNLYILEANKKRVVIINKTGALINQIYFPTASSPLDLYVDEAQRNLYLLDENKLFRITF